MRTDACELILSGGRLPKGAEADVGLGGGLIRALAPPGSLGGGARLELDGLVRRRDHIARRIEALVGAVAVGMTAAGRVAPLEPALVAPQALLDAFRRLIGARISTGTPATS